MTFEEWVKNNEWDKVGYAPDGKTCYNAGQEDAKALVEKMREALSELQAVVNGECPSLLNEDSGGDAQLDFQINDCIAEADKFLGGKDEQSLF